MDQATGSWCLPGILPYQMPAPLHTIDLKMLKLSLKGWLGPAWFCCHVVSLKLETLSIRPEVLWDHISARLPLLGYAFIILHACSCICFCIQKDSDIRKTYQWMEIEHLVPGPIYCRTLLPEAAYSLLTSYHFYHTCIGNVHVSVVKDVTHLS